MSAKQHKTSTATTPTASKQRYITETRPNDVLLGRGSHLVRHQGNIDFRRLVQTRKDDYVYAANISEKEAVAQEVIDITRSRKGRFLRQVKDAEERKKLNIPPTDQRTVWVRANHVTVLEKVKQAFRDSCKEAAAAVAAAVSKQESTISAPESNYHRLLEASMNLDTPAFSSEKSSHEHPSIDEGIPQLSNLSNSSGIYPNLLLQPISYPRQQQQQQLLQHIPQLLHYPHPLQNQPSTMFRQQSHTTLQQQQQEQHQITTASADTDISLAVLPNPLLFAFDQINPPSHPQVQPVSSSSLRYCPSNAVTETGATSLEELILTRYQSQEQDRSAFPTMPIAFSSFDLPITPHIPQLSELNRMQDPISLLFDGQQSATFPSIADTLNADNFRVAELFAGQQQQQQRQHENYSLINNRMMPSEYRRRQLLLDSVDRLVQLDPFTLQQQQQQQQQLPLSHNTSRNTRFQNDLPATYTSVNDQVAVAEILGTTDHTASCLSMLSQQQVEDERTEHFKNPSSRTTTIAVGTSTSLPSGSVADMDISGFLTNQSDSINASSWQQQHPTARELQQSSPSPRPRPNPNKS